MSFFHYLNLVNDPLKFGAYEDLMATQGDQYSRNVDEIDRYLNDEVLTQFDSLGIRPNFFCVFCHMGIAEQNVFGASAVHYDLAWYQNRWDAHYFAVNWEIVPSLTTCNWYDPKKITPVPPPQQTPKDQHNAYLTGMHYGTRFNKDPDGMILLESLQIPCRTPFLARTDVPHQITYKNVGHQPRMKISVRFDLDTARSWDQAVALFNPLIIPKLSFNGRPDQL
jgi:hypothetical protein